jgi:hypothetical protein
MSYVASQEVRAEAQYALLAEADHFTWLQRRRFMTHSGRLLGRLLCVFSAEQNSLNNVTPTGPAISRRPRP